MSRPGRAKLSTGRVRTVVNDASSKLGISDEAIVLGRVKDRLAIKGLRSFAQSRPEGLQKMSRTINVHIPEPRPDASDPAIFDVAAEEQARPGQFGLQVSAPPADLVTSDRLKGVRFDLAQPRGYFTEQVDTLVELLTRSLTWHEEALHQRDQGIHVLQTDLRAATQQEATLRAQVEVFGVQGSNTVGEDGQILRSSQVTAANDALAEAKGGTSAVDQRLAASIEALRSLRELADVAIPQTAQMAELARVAQEQLEVAVQELAAAGNGRRK